jgi:hypothetical protein
MGLAILNPGSTYARLAWPPIPVGHARKPSLKGVTTLFVYGELSIKQTWADFMLILIELRVWNWTHGFLHLLYFTNDSIVHNTLVGHVEAKARHPPVWDGSWVPTNITKVNGKEEGLLKTWPHIDSWWNSSQVDLHVLPKQVEHVRRWMNPIWKRWVSSPSHHVL